MNIVTSEIKLTLSKPAEEALDLLPVPVYNDIEHTVNLLLRGHKEEYAHMRVTTAEEEDSGEFTLGFLIEIPTGYRGQQDHCISLGNLSKQQASLTTLTDNRHVINYTLLVKIHE
jgi:hypothetical protein